MPLLSFPRVLATGGADDSIQLAVIEPVDRAVFATVDDDVACTAGGMRVHGLVALGTLKLAIQVPPVGLMRSIRGRRAPRAQMLDDLHKNVHRDQHPAAAVAVQEPVTAARRVDQWNGTART